MISIAICQLHFFEIIEIMTKNTTYNSLFIFIKISTKRFLSFMFLQKLKEIINLLVLHRIILHKTKILKPCKMIHIILHNYQYYNMEIKRS